MASAIENYMHTETFILDKKDFNMKLATYKVYPMLEKPVTNFDAVVIDTDCYKTLEEHF